MTLETSLVWNSKLVLVLDLVLVVQSEGPWYFSTKDSETNLFHELSTIWKHRLGQCTRCTTVCKWTIRTRQTAFQNLLHSSQTSRNNKKLSKGFRLWLIVFWPTHKLTRHRCKQFSYRTFLYRTNTKVYPFTSRRADFIHSQREIKKFSTLKNIPFPLNQSIKVHRRTLVLLLCLTPRHRCEKSSRESRNSLHFITQRDNIHARAHDTCVDQRGYMPPGWRNLF